MYNRDLVKMIVLGEKSKLPKRTVSRSVNHSFMAANFVKITTLLSRFGRGTKVAGRS